MIAITFAGAAVRATDSLRPSWEVCLNSLKSGFKDTLVLVFHPLGALLGSVGAPFETRLPGNSSRNHAVPLHGGCATSRHCAADGTPLQLGEKCEVNFLCRAEWDSCRRRWPYPFCRLSHKRQYIGNHSHNRVLSDDNGRACCVDSPRTAGRRRQATPVSGS